MAGVRAHLVQDLTYIGYEESVRGVIDEWTNSKLEFHLCLA